MHVTYLWREISIQEDVVLVECSRRLPKSRADIVVDVITVTFRPGKQMFTVCKTHDGEMLCMHANF